MTWRKFRKCKTSALNRGFKERAIVDALECSLCLPVGVGLMKNKQIKSKSGGGSGRRPDVLISINRYHILIEIDERQHTSPQYSSENNQTRINDIIKDLQTPLVLIRFNPDAYKSQKKTYKSLFAKSRDRLYKIGCVRKFDERMNVLKELVHYYLANEPKEAFVEHKLYYDNFDIDSLAHLRFQK